MTTPPAAVSLPLANLQISAVPSQVQLIHAQEPVQSMDARAELRSCAHLPAQRPSLGGNKAEGQQPQQRLPQQHVQSQVQLEGEWLTLVREQQPEQQQADKGQLAVKAARKEQACEQWPLARHAHAQEQEQPQTQQQMLAPVPTVPRQPWASSPERAPEDLHRQARAEGGGAELNTEMCPEVVPERVPEQDRASSAQSPPWGSSARAVQQGQTPTTQGRGGQNDEHPSVELWSPLPRSDMKESDSGANLAQDSVCDVDSRFCTPSSFTSPERTGPSVAPQKKQVDRDTLLFRSTALIRSTLMFEKVRRHVGEFGACWEFCTSMLRPPKDWSEEREHYERTLKFLESVPIFKYHLPHSELPKLARDLRRMTWQPGQVLVRQGEVGRAFFLIRSGEALVSSKMHDSDEAVSTATLYPGDYFGGHTLTTHRPNVATITCKGPAQLVTYSMSRSAFESSGLSSRLRFPKRPALGYNRGASAESARNVQKCSAEEQEFIVNAIKRNANLRALGEARTEMLAHIAASAELRELAAGEDAAKVGEVGREFFVIFEGSFDVIVRACSHLDTSNQRSAEAMVARSTMAERVRRKQSFLQDLYRPIGLDNSPKRSCPQRRRTQSLIARDPRFLMESPVSGVNSLHGQEMAHKLALRRGSTLLWSNSMDDGTTSQATLHGPVFKEGDRVVCLSALGPQRLGGRGNTGTTPSGAATVVSCCRRGIVEVKLEDGEVRHVEAELLRPFEDSGVVCKLRQGDSFGELSLLYNTRREATFRASQKSTVFVIDESQLRELLSQRGPRFEEDVSLLNQVPVLNFLLQCERWELARNRLGLVKFEPGETVIWQGKVREARLWYVIKSGSATLLQDERIIAELQKRTVFGEDSLLRAGRHMPAVSDVSVQAGKKGMTCLAFDGDLVFNLLQKAFGSATSSIPECSSSSMVGQKKCEAELQSLEKVRFLGRGGFGSVHLVRDVEADRQYALKKMSKGLIKEQGLQQQVCWERDLLRMVDSLFVVNLYRTFKDQQYVYFLMEAALGGNLYQLLKNHPATFRLDNPRCLHIAFYVGCIIFGLENMHERRIVFRDLKPENVLLDASGYGKLCDMGFARFVLGKTNTLAGTPEYMSPEQIEFPHTHDTNVDWWALGVLTFELVSGQTPFEDDGVADPHEKLLAIRRSQANQNLKFPFACPGLVKNFVNKLLRPLAQRLGSKGGAEAVRQHCWFERVGFDFDALKAQKLASPYTPPPLSDDGPQEDGPQEDESNLFVENEDEDESKWDAEF